MNKFRIGIIGGSGYVGSALAFSMDDLFALKIIDREPPRNLKGDRFEYKHCDVGNYDEIRAALSDVDLVVYTAIVQIPQINEQPRLGYGVNFLGTQNVCKIVDETPSIKGMLLTGTWHVFGEQELSGTIDETFGFRPDKVEDRAHLYALSKIAQEVIMRYYDKMSEKVYGVIRMGTILGQGMPSKTAANIFISNGLKGEPLTPFKHSMYRPMLYVDIDDICDGFKAYAKRILTGQIDKKQNGMAHVVNLFWPEPITIIDLAHMVQEAINKLTSGKIKPQIEVVDEGKPSLFEAAGKQRLKVDISRARNLLGLERLRDPRTSINRLVKEALHT